MPDSSLTNLERLARDHFGDRVSQVYHNRWTVSVVFCKPGHVAEAQEAFADRCHVYPISPVQVGLAWKEDGDEAMCHPE